MGVKFFKKSWFHILAWCVMFAYFIFAPYLFASFLIKNGKPIKINANIPPDSNRITFVIDGFEPYIQDGESLYKLYGWSLIVPDVAASGNSFVKEIALVSDETRYFFSVIPVHRNPLLPSEFANMEFDLDALGFSALILEDAIKPGKYRIGIIFKDVSTGMAYYSDKPSRYLIRTPNTIYVQK